MRALIIRPDDAELFQNNIEGEKLQFFITHLSAFKRMWTAQGKVYWLRFLLAFKSNFENTFMARPEFQFIFDMDEEAQWQSFVFIKIHKKFVHDSYSATKTFMDHILVVAQHLESLMEPNRMRNPFYNKESREAFRGLFGTPEVDEDIPAGPITFLSNIYSRFLVSVSTLLKRWLKESDLSDDAKKNVDYTYFYWKPPPEWSDEDFWPSCFEKYLAEVYGDVLPKMLLTANIHNVFLNHDECACNNHKGDINIFELFRSPNDDSGPFCMTQVGYLQPSVLDCTSHSNCYRKILHDPMCYEPYLCEGSNICILTCEKNQKKMNSGSKHSSFWKKVIVETFTCKLKNKRHVSTYAESHRAEVETFVHQQACCQSKNLQEEHANEYMMNMCGDPELLNCFNQHKRKEEFKNRLRSKFHQKYCFDANDFKDSSYCMNLFENARKTWVMGMLDEKLHNKNPNSDKGSNDKKKYVDGSILNSMESAETTVAVGTNSILSGRIVLPSSKGACSLPSCGCDTINMEPFIIGPSEIKSKPKSKRSRKKKKPNGVSNENNDGPSTSTNITTDNKAKVSAAESSEKKKVAISVPLQPPIDLSTKSEKNNKPLPCSAEDPIPCSDENQQVSHTDEVSQKMNHAQHDNKSETIDKDSTIIVKEPTLVNKSDCDNSQNECPLLNGDISKEASDQLCFGDCISQNTIGHICSQAVCSLEACCQCCVFVKGKREFSTQTDTFQDSTCVITEKPKKAPKPKINLIREAARLNGKTTEEQLKNCSTNLKDNANQTPKDGENSKKRTTLESNVGSVCSGDSQTTEKAEEKLTNCSTNLKVNANQTSKDDENSNKRTTLESNGSSNGSSGDSQTIKSIEATSKVPYTVKESVVSINDTLDRNPSNQKDSGHENPVQELVENDCGPHETTDVIEIEPSGSVINNDSENISETVLLDANEAINNLKFENDEDKTVEDFLTLIGILNKPSNPEEEIKSDSSAPSANPKCDTEVKDKKLKFKTCAFCGKKEVAYKTFKRCAKCKVDNFPEQRYYCSRQCQVDDWQESHRDEHLKKS